MITILIISLMPIAARTNEMPQVRGSDTMVNLVQVLAESYVKKNPGKYIAVTGGGSGNGLAGLRNRTADVANSSRTIRQKEIIDMRGKGVNPVGIIIGQDCITIVVNERNNVDKLTIAQLGNIFRGDITNWKNVGGTDMPITLYGRQSNSGTYLVFREVIVKDDYSYRMNRMNGNSQIVEAVRSDPSGIGYVGLGYAQDSAGLKVIRLAESDSADYIDPRNRSDVDAGKYTLVRPIYQYTDGVPQGAIRDFIKFELGPEGQKIVDEMGFIPIKKEHEEQNSQIAGI